jgi:hypothetical protein
MLTRLHLPVEAHLALPKVNVPWRMRGAWLLENGINMCGEGQESCQRESIQVLVLMITLCAVIVSIICLSTFFREDKEEQITPLCPALIVRDPEITFKLPMESEIDTMVVMDMDDKPVLKVSIDYPDPTRLHASGVAATARLQNTRDMTLATVVARNVAAVGQALALCRASPSCDIFGFVEPDGPDRYIVRHRTGVHLLTLVGDFAAMDIKGLNPVRSEVCKFWKVGDECRCTILQHFDAGLVFCSLLATQVQRRVAEPLLPRPGLPLPAPAAAPTEVTAETPAKGADGNPQGPPATPPSQQNAAEQDDSSTTPPSSRPATAVPEHEPGQGA